MVCNTDCHRLEQPGTFDEAATTAPKRIVVNSYLQ